MKKFINDFSQGYPTASAVIIFIVFGLVIFGAMAIGGTI
jgi:hypothetical protein